jgi:enoyl-CoA hydratase/carnithine racemase
MNETLVKTELAEDGIAVVTIDNPPVNAHNAGVLDQLMSTFDAISDRPEVRVVVLTGAGKIFCAGADMKELASLEWRPGDYWQISRRAREGYHSIMECKKPVIAAINGAAMGGGLSIAASCDILITSEAGFLCLPEIGVGLLGGCRHAQRLFGHSRLRRMMLTGMRVYGPELYRLGVAELCTAPEDLMPEALNIARQIALKSGVATSLAKHALNQIEELSLRDGYRFEQTMTGQLSASEDHKEAVLAFNEKRPPVFQHR